MIKYKVIPQKILISAICTFLAVQGYSQIFRTEFEFLNAANGLAQNHVFHINQDEDGFMWFCTMGGLSKYDGFKFTNYVYSEQDSTSISSNFTCQFFMDSKKRYWVTTANGLNLFDRKTGKFKRFYHDKNNIHSLGNNRLREITEDKDGYLWLVHNKGVDRFHPDTGVFEHYYQEGFEVGRHSGSIAIDANGDIWANSVHGFYKVLKDKKQLKKYDFPSIKADVPLEGRKIYIDSEGTMWVGLNRGMAIYDPINDVLYPFELELDDVNVVDIAEYPKGAGYMLIGTASGGFAVYNIKQKRGVNIFRYSPSDPLGLGGSSIYSFFVDKEKNLWIGLFSGLNRMNPYFQRFNLMAFATGINNYANFTLVIHQDKSNGFWSNTMEGLYYKKNIYDDHVNVLPYPQFRKGQNDVMCIESDDNGHVYFNVRLKNMYRYHTKTDKLEELNFGDYFTKYLVNKLTNDVKDPNKMWFGGTDGLGYFDKKSLDTTIYRPKDFLPNLSTNTVYRFIQSAEGKVYFIIDEKLLVLDPAQKKIVKLDPSFMPKGRCYAIGLRQNILWIGTAEHVYRYQLNDGIYDVIYRSDGVTPLKAVGLQVDSFGNVWSVSGAEVTLLDPESCHTSHFQSPTSFVNGIGTTSHNGNAIFGGANGALFLPKKLIDPNIKAKVVFTGLEIANKPVSFDVENEYITKLDLDYHDKVFTLRYSVLSFLDREKIKYLYKLEGFDDKWTDAGTRKDVTYTNLRPGRYVFKVIATTEEGRVYDESLQLPIYIKPPFYLTVPYFIFIASLVFLLIYIYYTINRRASDLRKAKELVEKNAQYKDMFMSNMSHEIRTPMNAIIGLNKILMDTPLNQQQKKYLEAIQTSGENLLWIVNDILDQAKIESGQYLIVNKAFSVKRLLAKIETLFGYRAEDKNLEFKISFDQELPDILIGDQVRIFQILTNLLNNAIKFTDTGHIHLNVNIKGQRANLFDIQFCIKDTGIGIPKDKIADIFESFHQLHEKESVGNQGVGLGLSIVKNLVTQLGGNIHVTSEPRVGTEIAVLLQMEASNTEENPEENQNLTLPQNLQILLVEDTPINQMIAIEFLKKYIPDVVVDLAENGAIAIEKITSKRYDLVLMDVKMPVMNGTDATIAIRKMDEAYYKNVPILGLTASAIPYQIKSCEEAGMNDVITKPINANELIVKMNNLLTK